MGNYSKLIASVIGGVLGIAASFGLPTDWATAEVQSAIAVIGSAIAVYFFPANKPSA